MAEPVCAGHYISQQGSLGGSANSPAVQEEDEGMQEAGDDADADGLWNNFQSQDDAEREQVSMPCMHGVPDLCLYEICLLVAFATLITLLIARMSPGVNGVCQDIPQGHAGLSRAKLLLQQCQFTIVR